MKTEVIHLTPAWIQRAVPRPLRRGLKCRNSLVERLKEWIFRKVLNFATRTKFWFNCSLMTCPVGELSTDPGRAQEEQEEDLGGVIGLLYYRYHYTLLWLFYQGGGGGSGRQGERVDNRGPPLHCWGRRCAVRGQLGQALLVLPIRSDYKDFERIEMMGMAPLTIWLDYKWRALAGAIGGRAKDTF